MKKIKPAETETLLRLIELADEPQNLEAFQYVVFQFDFQDYEQFVIEAPPGSIRFNNVIRVASFFDTVGALVEGEVIDPEILFEILPVPWTKVEPIVQGMRQELEWPDMFDHFEALAQRYAKWWEEKRKRLKVDGAMAPPPAARARVVSLSRPAAAAKPPATRPVPASRPAVAGRPGMVIPGGGTRPSPPSRPATRQAASLLGSPVARPQPPARVGQPQRPAAKPAAKGRGEKAPAKPAKSAKGAKDRSDRASAKGKPSRR